MHIKPMTQRLNGTAMKEWRAANGGYEKASALIKDKLQCSMSKAQKLATGRYPSLPSFAEQVALAELVDIPRDELFPLVTAKGKSRAS